MGEAVDLSNVNPVVKGKKKCCSYSSRSYSLGPDDLDWCLLRKFGAEFFGTMFLIIFCVGSANSRALAALGTNSGGYYLAISCAFGLGIGGIVHLLSSSSGGHVNPAVSFALFLDKRISLLVLIVYIIAQFLGGFAGAGILYGLGNHDALVTEKLNGIKGANSFDVDHINTAQAFFLEVFGTMFLVLTVLATTTEKRGHAPSYLQPLSIGIAILVMHIFLIPYTNCGINPVRGTVWNIITGLTDSQTVIFLFAPLVGSIVAVPLHNIFFA